MPTLFLKIHFVVSVIVLQVWIEHGLQLFHQPGNNLIINFTFFKFYLETDFIIIADGKALKLGVKRLNYLQPGIISYYQIGLSRIIVDFSFQQNLIFWMNFHQEITESLNLLYPN